MDEVTIPSIANPYTFTGRRFDEETGIYQYRHRYYHAQLGRFLSRDPIDYHANDPNLFSYVFASPTMLTDPFGLEPNPGQNDDSDLICGWYVELYAGEYCVTREEWISIIQAGGKGLQDAWDCWLSCMKDTNKHLILPAAGGTVGAAPYVITPKFLVKPLMSRASYLMYRATTPNATNISHAAAVCGDYKAFSLYEFLVKKRDVFKDTWRVKGPDGKRITLRGKYVKGLARKALKGIVVTESLISIYCSAKCYANL